MKPFRSDAIRSAGALLCFRRGRHLLLRLGLCLRCFPPNRRGFRRHFLAIQISDAASAFDFHPVLLTHDAFYRAEESSAQREIRASRRSALNERAGRAEKQGSGSDAAVAKMRRPGTSSLVTPARAACCCIASLPLERS